VNPKIWRRLIPLVLLAFVVVVVIAAVMGS